MKAGRRHRLRRWPARGRACRRGCCRQTAARARTVSTSWSAALEQCSAKDVPLVGLPLETAAGFDTLYEAVVADGDLRRTILTRPAGSGRLPAVLFVGGIGCYSMESPFDEDEVYRRLLSSITRLGFVTMRVEKSGMGDSRGAPCAIRGSGERTRRLHGRAAGASQQALCRCRTDLHRRPQHRRHRRAAGCIEDTGQGHRGDGDGRHDLVRIRAHQSPPPAEARRYRAGQTRPRDAAQAMVHASSC